MKYNPGHFTKGHKPWNTGKKVHLSPNTEFKKGEHINERHPLWKGDNVSYVGLHMWLARKLGKPNVCENCGTAAAKRYEWANLSGEYRRDLSDWARLCKSCHNLIDDITRKGWETRKSHDKIS